jgi:hypothetical protein
MTLWLTLLLVWTTGIPAAVLAGATLTAQLHERPHTRLPGLRGLTPRPAHACHRRDHSYSSLAHSRRGFAARRR